MKVEHQDKVNFQDSTEVQLSSVSEEDRARERVLTSPLSKILEHTISKNVLLDYSDDSIELAINKEIHNAQNESPPSS